MKKSFVEIIGYNLITNKKEKVVTTTFLPTNEWCNKKLPFFATKKIRKHNRKKSSVKQKGMKKQLKIWMKNEMFI